MKSLSKPKTEEPKSNILTQPWAIQRDAPEDR